MCIIAVKVKGVDFAPVDIIANCIDTNRHGNAMAWNENGELHVFKSMDKEETLAKYAELKARLDPAETALIFHARIATHGSQCIANCHCWDHEGKYAFAHNGVLSNVGSRDDMTDSETFFRDIFVPAYEKVGPEYARKVSSAIVGSSRNKFAVIDKDGHVWLLGDYDYKVQFPGCRGKIYFSNSSFFPKSTYGFDTRGAFRLAERPVRLPDMKGWKPKGSASGKTSGKDGKEHAGSLFPKGIL